MTNTFTIRTATPSDFAILPALELNAAAAFAALDMTDIASLPPIGEQDYVTHQNSQHVLLAEMDERRVIGFCILREMDGQGYFRELGVAIDHAGQGVGRRLLDAAVQWARASSYDYLLLTTFEHVPFNAPFYERYGFVRLQPGDPFPALARQLRSERDGILGNYARVAMRYHL
ncbi:GNAT family N-acetyltransferase [Sneathiella glossodoripedis]|uniref:GNAT family N-acetyltransferase n=1 Tax=Sneathiella glossodoripedis TaxID=418853 RepID=UPI00046FBB80|nr:GNAT family N-acetyltransferase [Sneathiella glossodoripedis]